MTWERIRPLAIGVVRDGDRIFVGDGYDPVNEELFYRPIGGGVEFGEYSYETLSREFEEELNVEITNLRYLGTIENIFEFKGGSGHEVSLVYEADFVDEAMYETDPVTGYDDGGVTYEALWKPFEELKDEDILYPEGLLDLLTQTQNTKKYVHRA